MSAPVNPLALAAILKFSTIKFKNKMAGTNPPLRTCKNGHQYYKSSDCPTCPICEAERKPKDEFLSLLSAPARRALEHNNITTLQGLAKYTEAEILKFHGMGPGSIPKLKNALKENGLDFKNE
jgi:DNA-directed RNA polymerase alpha subunit